MFSYSKPRLPSPHFYCPQMHHRFLSKTLNCKRDRVHQSFGARSSCVAAAAAPPSDRKLLFLRRLFSLLVGFSASADLFTWQARILHGKLSCAPRLLRFLEPWHQFKRCCEQIFRAEREMLKDALLMNFGEFSMSFQRALLPALPC